MATQIGVTSTYGITLPANAQAQSAQRVSNLDLIEVLNATGEIGKLIVGKAARQEISIEYIGAPGFANVTLAQGVTPSTSKITKVEMTEEPNKSNSGTITGSAHTASSGTGGVGTGLGVADTDIGTIVLKSVTCALADSVRRSVEIKDVVVIGGDGTPAWRGSAVKKGSFSVRFKGDIPSGVVTGTSGAGLYAFTGGVLVVNKLTEEQKADDVNGGSYDGAWAPTAA